MSGYSHAFHAPYFLLLSQDTGFLWRTHSDDGASALQQFPMREVVARYLPNRAAGDRLDEFGLSLVVVHWLNELAAGVWSAEDEPERHLAQVGLLDAMRGADITVEPAR